MSCEVKETELHTRRTSSTEGRAQGGERRQEAWERVHSKKKEINNVFNVLTHAKCCSKYLSTHNNL